MNPEEPLIMHVYANGDELPTQEVPPDLTHFLYSLIAMGIAYWSDYSQVVVEYKLIDENTSTTITPRTIVGGVSKHERKDP